jgi:hypothetical protein
MTDAASRSHIQRDGKTLTIDTMGHVKRLLPSGARDPEPLGGRSRPHERVREELSRRLMHNIPLTADNIVFARPKPESVAAFNQARTEWTGGVRAERSPWGRRQRDDGDDARNGRKR